MSKLSILALAVVVAGCGPSPDIQEASSAPDITQVHSLFRLSRASGSGINEVRTFTIDGTRCIYVGRYSAVALSCDWGKP